MASMTGPPVRGDDPMVALGVREKREGGSASRPPRRPAPLGVPPRRSVDASQLELCHPPGSDGDGDGGHRHGQQRTIDGSQFTPG